MPFSPPHSRNQCETAPSFWTSKPFLYALHGELNARKEQRDDHSKGYLGDHGR